MIQSRKRVLATMLSFCMVLSVVLAAVPMTASAASVSYTAVDYSTEITLGAKVSGSINSEDTIVVPDGTVYGNTGYTVSLESGVTYSISYTLTAADGMPKSYLDPIFCVLTGKEFQNDSTDVIRSYSNAWNNCVTVTETFLFTLTEKGEYRILPLVFLDSSDFPCVIDYSFTIVATETAEPDWSISLEKYTNYMIAATADGTVYVPTSTGLAPDVLLAVDKDGNEMRQFEVDGYISTSPLVGPDGTIYVGAYVDGGGSLILYAINADGTQNWSHVAESSEDTSYFGQMALSDSGILMVTRDDDPAALVGFDAATGTLLWENEEGRYGSWCTWGGHVLYGNTVYVSNNDNLSIVAINVLTGATLWETDALDDCCGAGESSLSVDKDGTLYLVCDGKVEIDDTALQCPVYAINPDGSVKWVKEYGLWDNDSFQTAVDENYVYVGANTKILTLNKADGSLVKEINFDDVLSDSSSSEPDFTGLTLLDDGSMIAQLEGLLLQFTPEGLVSRLMLTEGYAGAVLTETGGLYVIGNDNLGHTLLYYNLGVAPRLGWAMSGGNAQMTNNGVWSRAIVEEEEPTEEPKEEDKREESTETGSGENNLPPTNDTSLEIYLAVMLLAFGTFVIVRKKKEN